MTRPPAKAMFAFSYTATLVSLVGAVLWFNSEHSGHWWWFSFQVLLVVLNGLLSLGFWFLTPSHPTENNL